MCAHDTRFFQYLTSFFFLLLLLLGNLWVPNFAVFSLSVFSFRWAFETRDDRTAITERIFSVRKWNVKQLHGTAVPKQYIYIYTWHDCCAFCIGSQPRTGQHGPDLSLSNRNSTAIVYYLIFQWTKRIAVMATAHVEPVVIGQNEASDWK